MTERLPSHNFDWFAFLEIGFVPADIWISWFGPFAFVKPSLSHLRVLELECWISPETSFVFSMSNHPHFYLVQRHLRSTFDPEGERVMLKENHLSHHILVLDVSLMKWPERLDVVVEKKELGGAEVAVFMLNPSV